MISLHISFDFFAQNTPIISAKRLPQTAKNGVHKKTLFLYSIFSKSEVSIVGYLEKKRVIAKMCQKRSVPWEIQKKNLDWG